MALLSEIAAYLATASPTLGTIRTGRMPTAPDELVVVSKYPGATPNTGFGTAGIKYEMPGVQIRVRGLADKYATPEALIERAYQHLAKVQAMTLSGVFYLMVRAQGSPFLLEVDTDRRHVFAANFLCEKEPS